MSKIIKLHLKEDDYKFYKKLAESENITFSNFIEMAVQKFVEHNYADEFEMNEIRNNVELNKSLKRGAADMKLNRGYLVES